MGASTLHDPELRASRACHGLVLFAALILGGLGCSFETLAPNGSLQDEKSEGDAQQERHWSCQIPEGGAPDFVQRLGCSQDFHALASAPADESIPGARSVKVVVDRWDDNALYFQHSKRFAIHWEFASAHLSGRGHPVVPSLAQFNRTEYYSPDRRFVLGALSYYQGPKRWVFELSPYDSADAQMIQSAFETVADHSFVGPELAFHPTSEAMEKVAAALPESIPVIESDALFEGVEYQALNLGESYGRLRVMGAAELSRGYLNHRDIVVLDEVPNDISVAQGIVTSTFQTPLSHINVLSQNRKTPNMALKGAHLKPEIRALEGKWVRLRVETSNWSLQEVSAEQAEQWWQLNRPEPLGMPALDLDRKELRDCASMLNSDEEIESQIKALIPAYGGKASHYGALVRIEGVPSPKAFAIPVFYYRQFMEQNGFLARVQNLLKDARFESDPAYRDAQLKALRTAMKAAPIDEGFIASLRDKLRRDYPGLRMRFRSSTNAEDLEGFSGAGLYTSKSGQLDSSTHPIENAIRKVWASVWFFRAFEERSYRSIDHLQVGMAILVHRSFPDEEANGVALTANPFDVRGVEPGFYINVQAGEASVVKPDPGVRTDQYIHHWEFPGQPRVFLGHSSLVQAGDTVLDDGQQLALGKALDQIHRYFRSAYGPESTSSQRWYAMDVEFKFDEPTTGGPVQLWVKQARPHPGRGKTPAGP